MAARLCIVAIAGVAAGRKVGEQILLIGGPLGGAPEPAAPARLVVVRPQYLLPMAVIPAHQAKRV